MIRAARLVEHHWPLPGGAQSAAGTWNERRALLLVLEDSGGLMGLGEAAPLPGFSQDTLETARDALLPLLGHSLPDHEPHRAVTDALREVSAPLASAAARCALESALLDLWSRRAHAPAWSLLTPPNTREAPERVKLALWLPDGTGAALAAAEQALARGVATFKVKLDTARGLEGGIATLETLRRALGPTVALRADANRSATRAELEPFVARLQALALEWLEEPTRAPLTEAVGVPLALDESLQAENALPSLAERPFISALVLKPTALGGLSRCLALASDARAHGRAAVASHALEGPVGFMAAASLAVALGAGPAHGLAPYLALRGARPPALAPDADELVRWRSPGFGLDVADALDGSSIAREHRA